MSKFGKLVSFIFILTVCSILPAQVKTLPEKAEVMTLGVFHFSFPNLDVKKIEKKDQIDIYEKKYQGEIVKIVKALKEFKPTRIVIERTPAYQKKADSLYEAYRQGKHSLARDETEQLGFRLAKEMNIKKLECVDTWGRNYESLAYLFSDTSARAKAFDHYYFNNPDSIYESKGTGLNFSNGRGLIDNLKYLNNRKRIKESLGSYLTGHFKYEEKEGDYTGCDFETGRWFSRNLRILRNIQRFNQGPSDRIVVIYGCGHLNLLNYFFESSPEYKLVSPEAYLTKAGK
jgi:hypothetical protein